MKHEIVRIIDDKKYNSENEFQFLVRYFTNEMATSLVFDQSTLLEVIYKLSVIS